MPRLIPADRGNGKRPSDPAFEASISESAVPVLDVSDKTHDLVGDKHEAQRDPDQPDELLLLGQVVQIDNQRPRDSSHPGPVTIHVGASTLHEAATEVIGAFENLALDMPEWVASSDGSLAKVVAEHFTVAAYNTCKVIKLSEVSA